MIKEGFIEANKDTLDEVDIAIKKIYLSDFMNEMELSVPLFSKGLYFLQRNNKDALQEVIPQIDIFLQNVDLKQIPLMYINSIIYTILGCARLNIETDICKNLLDKLFLVTKQNINDCTKENLTLLQRNISMMKESDCSKWTSLTDAIATDINNSQNIYENYWIDLLFPNGRQTHSIKMPEIDVILSDKIKIVDYDSLSIYNGLAGMGLYLIRNKNTII